MSMKLSYLIADFFIAQNWIKEEEKIIYVVGMDVLLSTSWQIALVLFLGIWRDRFVEAVVYLLFIQSVRQYSGGYHASTRTRCYTLFTVCYLIADAAAAYIGRNASIEILVLYGLCSLVFANTVFYLFAPIKNDRKKYRAESMKDARKKAFAAVNIWYCLAAGTAFAKPAITAQIFTAGNIVTLLILLCRPWRKKHE
ncbi:MAG: accessory gene regulator B family protein [Lachnospiraceae bacterium]|nr:accessory gene regulator B family protein [Lachnospiraceae bacterium]